MSNTIRTLLNTLPLLQILHVNYQVDLASKSSLPLEQSAGN